MPSVNISVILTPRSAVLYNQFAVQNKAFKKSRPKQCLTFIIDTVLTASEFTSQLPPETAISTAY